MRLRNKKTGEIKEYTHTMTSYYVPIDGGYEIFTPWKPEEWEELEDVKEPLIKDEETISFISLLERFDRKLSKLCGEEEE